MRSRYRWAEEDAPHFLTMTIVEWLPVFRNQKYFEIITHSLEFCRKNKGLKIHTYVILDNHLHLIASGKNLANTIKEFKSFTAREIVDNLQKDKKAEILEKLAFHKKSYKQDSEHQVWQEGSHPQLVVSDDMLDQKIDYIHLNPVKRGLVTDSEDWVYSSAKNYASRKGAIEVDFLEA
ncbi:MAG: hypothetical protein K9L85_00765 [Candidatus Peribacteraceae bacterium]|nr:hypothetical protein [Candidatus Peribacteraceae bacterium]